MCGVTGIYAFNLVGKFNKVNVTAATMALEKRGPDVQDIYLDEWVALGHRRLSIIDTSPLGNQPMWDDTGRYGIVYNGEIFNFMELKRELAQKGVLFRSTSDTEVLLHLFIKEKENCLSKLNGFFSFCIYDREERSLFLARDHFGIKPLLYFFDEDKFIFSSEMTSLLKYGIEKRLNYQALYTYLQLNYVPAPESMLIGVKKLLPGHYLKVTYQHLEEQQYYSFPTTLQDPIPCYEEAQKKFLNLLEKAVHRRLVADVPLGSFLSGGIDSSAIAALAVRAKPDLLTFSIGFKDEKFFDETPYALAVAKHLKTNHTVFSLSNNDLLSHLDSILNTLSEPFADSSALAVYMLSMETRKHATVALSGDGADELLAGYNKHRALQRCLNPGWKEYSVKYLRKVWKILPHSRNNHFGNRIRQFRKFSEGMALEEKDRYWRWAGFSSEQNAWQLLSFTSRKQIELMSYNEYKAFLLSTLQPQQFNSVLATDCNLVLGNDMLTKVDLMSMANSLEVRPPFLDLELVNFIATLPASYKINTTLQKRILQESVRNLLPETLFNRPKKGFEVPLLRWFRKELKNQINNDWLSDSLIREQGIFDLAQIQTLKARLFSSNPGDVHAQIWGIIVFQDWWKKHLT